MSTRFRRLTDLFVDGRTVTLPDDTHLFIRAINSYERDECISDAQVARARLILALKENGNERVKVEALFAREGRDKLVDDLASLKSDDKYSDVVAAMEADPEWSERVEVMRRTDFDNAAKPALPEEQAYVASVFTDWADEVQKRLADERDFIANDLTRLSDEQLLDEYLDAWLAKRGGELASAEYLLTEMWYATRYCDAVADRDGVLDHSRCEGHTLRVFETKADARAVPDGLQALVRGALDELTMAARDPKGLASHPSSSASSPPPSEGEESVPSGSVATPETPPGT